MAIPWHFSAARSGSTCLSPVGNPQDTTPGGKVPMGSPSNGPELRRCLVLFPQIKRTAGSRASHCHSWCCCGFLASLPKIFPLWVSLRCKMAPGMAHPPQVVGKICWLIFAQHRSLADICHPEPLIPPRTNYICVYSTSHPAQP